MSQCDRCKWIGVGVPDQWGHIIGCQCIPDGKSCKDCKFESMCLLEKIIKGSEKDGFCKSPFDRGFAEHGQLSYRELVKMERDKQDRAWEMKQAKEKEEFLKEKQKRDLLEQNTLVWTEIMIVEFILPYNLRKIYKTLPEGMTEERAIELSKPKDFLASFLEQTDDPYQAARACLDTYCPSWRMDVGERVPERVKKLLMYHIEKQVKIDASA